MRIAITSTDGKIVNEPFEMARDFFIYDLAGEHKVFIERRSANRYSISLENPRFKRNRFKQVVDTIKDCKSVYTKAIGEMLAGKLTEAGIEPRIHCGCVSKI
jgi:predicted Fe-Mo cluster-binding NifX family protein